MPAFEYHVKDKSGKTQAGVQDAPDAQALVASLRQQGFFIMRIQEVKKAQLFSVGKGPGKKRGKQGALKLDDIVILSRQMATLVGAGIPLIQALDILGQQMDKERFRIILRDMHMAVQGGKSFSDAMEKHQRTFSVLFINMVRAGESSGNLEEILDRVASYLEKTSALQKKVKSAMMYPAVVTTIALIITLGMMMFVIPKFAEIFEGLNAPLPTPTRILIQISHYLASHWYIVIGGLVGSVFFFRQIVRTPTGRLLWDSVKLKFPVFGPIFLKVAVSKFSRTFATLVKSGVQILIALDIVSKTSGNRRLELIIASLMSSVKKGESLSGPLGKSEVFPPMVVRMIAIGEETGELEEMLVKIADFYDTEVDAAVDGLTSLIEPLIIAFLGIVIGGIVVAMFLPVLTLTQALNH